MLETILCFVLIATVLSCNYKSDTSDFGRLRGDGFYKSDESIDISTEGGMAAYTYGWSNNDESEDLEDLQSGNYTVTVTDMNGSVSSNSITDGKIIPEKVIKHGTINMRVEDYEASLKKLKELVKAANGYIGNESENRSSYQISNHIQIRVRNGNFEQLLDKLAALSFELHLKQSSATDVTEEYYDLEARLKAKRKVEQRYIQILLKADSVEDILKVERQLSIIREEIEAKEGRLKYLNNRVSQSTISLDMYQKLDHEPAVAKGEGFFGKMGDALQGGWKGILNFIIGITYLWPFGLLIMAIIILASKILKRRNAKRMANA